MKNKAVAVDAWTAQQIEKFCTPAGISKREFLKISMAYFQKNGINPLLDESPKSEIKKLRERMDFLISFNKKHEQNLFDALKNQQASLKVLIQKNSEQLGTEIISEIKLYTKTIHALIK